MKRLCLLSIFFLSVTSYAVVPTAKEAKSVTDYFFNGHKKGPMLLEFKPCLDVEEKKNSPKRFECVKAARAKVKKGTKLTAWTSWLVPEKGIYDDIMIQFVHDGMVRTTQDIKLNGGLRKRAFRTQTLSKPGNWEIRVLKGKKTISTAKITVIK